MLIGEVVDFSERLHLTATLCGANAPLHPAHKVRRIFVPDHKKQCILKLHTQSDLDEVVRMENDRSCSSGRR